MSRSKKSDLKIARNEIRERNLNVSTGMHILTAMKKAVAKVTIAVMTLERITILT